MKLLRFVSKYVLWCVSGFSVTKNKHWLEISTISVLKNLEKVKKCLVFLYESFIMATIKEM